MIWINGANFAAMKDANLLFDPFAEDLPNWKFVDVDGKTVTSDFTVPTDGYESGAGCVAGFRIPPSRRRAPG